MKSLAILTTCVLILLIWAFFGPNLAIVAGVALFLIIASFRRTPG